MKARTWIRARIAVALGLALSMAIGICGLTSCGTIRTHAGIEHEYRYDFDDGHHHGHHKPKKPKKHHKKHKHHHGHHHD